MSDYTIENHLCYRELLHRLLSLAFSRMPPDAYIIFLLHMGFETKEWTIEGLEQRFPEYKGEISGIIHECKRILQSTFRSELDEEDYLSLKKYLMDEAKTDGLDEYSLSRVLKDWKDEGNDG